MGACRVIVCWARRDVNAKGMFAVKNKLRASGSGVGVMGILVPQVGAPGGQVDSAAARQIRRYVRHAAVSWLRLLC